jgi:hypothetical protein
LIVEGRNRNEREHWTFTKKEFQVPILINEKYYTLPLTLFDVVVKITIKKKNN